MRHQLKHLRFWLINRWLRFQNWWWRRKIIGTIAEELISHGTPSADAMASAKIQLENLLADERKRANRKATGG